MANPIYVSFDLFSPIIIEYKPMYFCSFRLLSS